MNFCATATNCWQAASEGLCNGWWAACDRFEICNRFEVVIGLGDLAYPSYLEPLEYDGGQHRSDECQFHIDTPRLDAFMEQKWRVTRVDKSLMQQRSRVLSTVRTALETSGRAAPKP